MPLKTVYSYVQKLFILKHNIINTQLDRQYALFLLRTYNTILR